MGVNRKHLGVQAHCLRRELAMDFGGTLGRLSALDFREIELCSFPGCAGNPWGDFGALANESPGYISDALREAALACVATHVTPKELSPDAFETTVRWAQGVGAPVVVLGGTGDMTGADREAWRKVAGTLNTMGARLADRGLGFALHTQNDVWRTVEGTLPMRDLLEITDPALCAIELDPSGALVSGADWKSVVREHPGRFFSMHLRDGVQPENDVPYLPAVPLGQGDEHWPSALEAAADAGISRYLLEMEVEAGQDVFAALQDSLAYLERIGWLADPDTRDAA